MFISTAAELVRGLSNIMEAARERNRIPIDSKVLYLTSAMDIKSICIVFAIWWCHAAAESKVGIHKGQMKGGQGEIGNSLAKFCGGFQGSNPIFHVLKKHLGFFLVLNGEVEAFHPLIKVLMLLMATLPFLYDRSHQRCGFYRHISTLRLRHTQVLVRGGARTPLEPLELLGSEFYAS